MEAKNLVPYLPSMTAMQIWSWYNKLSKTDIDSIKGDGHTELWSVLFTAGADDKPKLVSAYIRELQEQL